MITKFMFVGTLALALSTSAAQATMFVYTGGIQDYSVADAGIYQVQANGAQGGAALLNNVPGGYGAALSEYATFGANTALQIIVGGQGGNGTSSQNGGTFPVGGGGGGGGGTFVIGGSNPYLIAGGGGGSGLQNPGVSASLSQDGGEGGLYSYGGYNGYGALAGMGNNRNSGGGGGLIGPGNNGKGPFSGNGGKGGPSHAGGAGSQLWNSGGFGGGAGGSAGAGGGGGGYSGGGGDYGNDPGGGGGSYFANGATHTSAAVLNSGGDGSASITAVRLFARAYEYVVGSINNQLSFGTVRLGTIVKRQMFLQNSATAGPVTDKLLVTYGALPSSQLTGSQIDSLSPLSHGVQTYTLNATTPGQLSGSVQLGFTSHPVTGSDVTLPSVSVPVSGTVTDPARASISSTGAGMLSFVQGNYILDLGNVIRGMGVTSTQFSFQNDVTKSAFSEGLGAYFNQFTEDGFTFNAGSTQSLGYVSPIAGGMQSKFGVLNFDTAGLSLGGHSTHYRLEPFTHFDGLSDLFFGHFKIIVEANVIAAPPPGSVPEPGTWAMMVAGFGSVGAAMRRRGVIAAKAAMS